MGPVAIYELDLAGIRAEAIKIQENYEHANRLAKGSAWSGTWAGRQERRVNKENMG